MAARFRARGSFPQLKSLPRSYFLGHHLSGLREMRKILSSIDLIIECRDYRVPITSRNPLLEEHANGKQRLIIFTKHDLGSCGSKEDRRRDGIIREWHDPTTVLFSDFRSARSVNKILASVKSSADNLDNLTGARAMVIGMPNVGKSSLLNALRKVGLGKGKAAITGAQPGVTRKIGHEVRIAGDPKIGNGLYVVDTPGVFVPYVSEPESMLKLCICGSVKDTIISPVILADYLLFRLNLEDPGIYKQFCEPTNDVNCFLESTAQRTGRLRKGGAPDTEGTALWIIQRWRTGQLGKFVLDQVDKDSLQRHLIEEREAVGSLSSARKLESRAQSSIKGN